MTLTEFEVAVNAAKDRLWANFIVNCAAEEDLPKELQEHGFGIRDTITILRVVKAHKEREERLAADAE